MQSYRCLLLDESNAIVEWAEFSATNDHTAEQQAVGHIEFHPRAVGYSLWQGGRLVIEHRSRECVAAQSSTRRGTGD